MRSRRRRRRGPNLDWPARVERLRAFGERLARRHPALDPEDLAQVGAVAWLEARAWPAARRAMLAAAAEELERGRRERAAGLCLAAPDETAVAAEDLVQRADERALLDVALQELSYKKRTVITCRIADDPLTLNELARALRLTRSRVAQIESRAHETVSRRLTLPVERARLAQALRDGHASAPPRSRGGALEWHVDLSGGAPPSARVCSTLRESEAVTPRQLLRLTGELGTNDSLRELLELMTDAEVSPESDQPLDVRLVFAALVGSPHVRRAEAPERRLLVRRAGFAIHVRTCAAGITLEALLGHLRLTQEPEPHLAIVVAVDPHADTVLVGRVAGAVVPLVRALARRPLTLPWGESEALLVRLTRLQQVVPLIVTGQTATSTVAPDRCVRVILEPRGARAEDGLHVTFRVRPLALALTDEDPLARPRSGMQTRLTERQGLAFAPGEGPDVLLAVRDRGLVGVRREPAEEVGVAWEVIHALELRRGSQDAPWTYALDLERSLSLLASLRAWEGPALLVEWPAGERLRSAGPVDVSALQVVVRRAGYWFELDGALEVDGERVALAVVMTALRSGQAHVALSEGHFARLTERLRGRLEALRGLTTLRGHALTVDDLAAPLAAEALDGVHVDADAAWRDLLARLDASRTVDVSVPPGLRGELRSYQREGWAWLKRLATLGVGGCLADDMGVGKTVQAIAALLDRAPLGPALVVAPTSVGPTWTRELARFAPSLRTTLLRETRRDAAALSGFAPGDVVVTSYDLARLDVDALSQVDWGTLILDEAQRVKNAHTKTAEALGRLRAGWRLALTGTPVENRLADLWSLFRIVAPGLLGDWATFKARCALPIEVAKDAAQAAALARLLQPYLLRRTKAQVLGELPPLTERRVEVTLSPAERALYDDARLDALARLEGGGAGSGAAHLDVLVALTRLRQLACHPALVEPAWPGSSAKLEALLELVRQLQEGGHRALVFSQFTAHLDLVGAALEAEGVPYHRLDGSTRARERQRAVDAFQRGERPLFLVSVKAGGVGLDLTGADHVIHLDPWWNPAVEDQATSRAHRPGQARAVTAHRLVSLGTIEERILALHADKRGLVASLFEGADRAAALTTAELVALIRGDDQRCPQPA